MGTSEGTPTQPETVTRSRTIDFAEIASNLKVTEVTAKNRATTIRRLAEAAKLEAEGLSVDCLVDAIEEREAAAQTVVAPGFAVPHALTDWDGELRVVLGRSRSGIDYGTSDTEAVHLVMLLVIGSRGRARHLEFLASLAEFFADDGFRDQLISAKDTQALGRLIREKAGLLETPKKPAPKLPKINTIMMREAIGIVPKISAQALLVAADSYALIPWPVLDDWSGRLLLVSPEISDAPPIQREDTHLIEVPHASMSRTDRANLGLLLSAAKGLVTSESDVVCLTGAGGPRLDNISVVRPAPHFESMFGPSSNGRKKIILPAVILRAVAIALELAEQGREGKAVGTMFVIGDSRHVLKHTQQLVLNPFHGYSRSLRSILDPSLGETIKEFALLDGAFIVQVDGIVLSAGTYVIPMVGGAKLTPGLGTRHQAAASITSHTDAMAIVVSQSTGTVVAFRGGKVVLKLERSGAAKA